MSTALAFELPRRLEATQPPPERDRVRLLVASRGGIRHERFLDLPEQLEPGDLLVVNASATLPAALPVDGSAACASTSRRRSPSRRGAPGRTTAASAG